MSSESRYRLRRFRRHTGGILGALRLDACAFPGPVSRVARHVFRFAHNIEL